MTNLEPTVKLIAKTEIDFDAMADYVRSVGGDAWVERILAEFREVTPETLIEFAGRQCYRSWDVDLNPNVTQVRTDSEKYLQNIVSVNHGSVLEHVQFTFVLSNVSRVFTHEIVRHRVGVAISQESQRYVRLDKIPFKHPDWVLSNPRLKSAAETALEAAEEFQRLAVDEMNLDGYGIPFSFKKQITSDMRRYAPNGVLTSMTWSANLRTLRHTILLRTSVHAEQELRVVFDQIATLVKAECPALFADLNRNEDGSWTSNL